MSEPQIEIHIAEGFEPNDRLRAALEAVARAHQAEETETIAAEAEVAGYADSLKIGDVIKTSGIKMSEPPPRGWRDGCWVYNDDGCGWFQTGEGDTSCVALKFA